MATSYSQSPAGLHIPLNEELDRAGDPGRITDLAEVRNQFEGPWVAGNIVRTLFSTAAVAALARALLLHGRSSAAEVPGCCGDASGEQLTNDTTRYTSAID